MPFNNILIVKRYTAENEEYFVVFWNESIRQNEEKSLKLIYKKDHFVEFY
jgi:hypothetical protein